jgi:hypothetical protein
VVAGLLVTALLAGCGGDGDDGTDSSAPAATSGSQASTPAGEGPAASPPRDRILAASQLSADSGTAKLDMTVQVALGGQEQELRAEGAIDYGQRLTLLEMTLPGQSGAVTILTAGDTLYLRGLPGQPADGWSSLDAEQSSALGLDSSQTDPTQTLRLLQGVSDDVREDGTETIRGVEATKYVGTINVEEALKAAGEGLGGEQQEQARRSLESMDVDEIPFTVFLDDENRPVRLVQELTLTQAGQEATTSTTIDMYDWGQPVAIAVPDPADVTELDLGGAPSPAPTPGS